MDFESLKIGDKLKIEGKIFEIIGIMDYDVECLPPKYEIRNMISFNLLEEGSKRITPTHHIGYYFDTREAFFSSENVRNREILKLGKENFQIIS